MNHEIPIANQNLQFKYKTMEEWKSARDKVKIEQPHQESFQNMLVQNIDYMVNFKIEKKNTDIVNELITNYLHKLADHSVF